MIYSYIAIAAYAAICLAILLFTIRQTGADLKVGGLSREAIGSGRYGWLLIAITVSVTMLGPADALGLSGKGYEYGLIWAAAPIGAALAQIIAGVFFVHKIKTFPGENQTIGDILASKYGESVRPATGLIVTLQAVAFSGVLVLAGAQILDVFLGLPKLYGLLITSISIGIFTSAGGLSSVVRMDVFQGILMLAALILVAGVAVAVTPSAINWLDPLPFETPKFHQEVGYYALLSALLTYMFGEFLLPIYSQRALIARTASDARIGFILAGVLAAAWYIVITYSGVVASASPNDSADPEFVIIDNIKLLIGESSILLPVAMAIALVSLFALLHSTFDGILNAGGVSFSRDIASYFFSLDDKGQGRVARRAMLAFAILGMIVPFKWPDMIEMLLVGYTVWAPTLMPILVFSLLSSREKYSPSVFWIPFVAGGFGWGITNYAFPSAIPAILIGVLANFLAIFFMTRISKTSTRNGTSIR